MLPEQGPRVEDVERDAVGQLDEVELGLFRQEFVDVRREEGVGLEDLGADGALHGGFDFRFGAGGEGAVAKKKEGMLVLVAMGIEA